MDHPFHTPIVPLMDTLYQLEKDLSALNTPDHPETRSRELSLAITKLEEALMWGYRAVDVANQRHFSDERTM